MERIQLWQLHGLALLTGSILDWIFGDPYNFPHMIRLMGNMISSLEKDLRKLFPEKPRLAGTFLTMTMCLFWIIMPELLFQVTGKYLGLTARFLLESFFCYQLLAAKSLCVESMKVCRELKKGDIEGARKAVSTSPHFRLSANTGSISASRGRREKCLAYILKRPQKA